MTRLEVDLEVIEETARGTRFERALAILIGTIALLAAVLALIQTNASLEGNRASLLTTRLGAAITERIATSQSYNDYVLDRQRAAIVLGVGSTSRLLTGLEQGDSDGTQEAIGTAQEAASQRLAAIVPQTARVPAGGGPLDAHTVEVILSEVSTLNEMVTEREGIRDLAGTWNVRASWAVLGLTFLALSGVLGGLTAILGQGRAGRIALGTAAATTAAAAVVGVIALL
jgi:hypothetical protein